MSYPLHLIELSCSFCNSLEVGDETHVLFSCTLYNGTRLDLYNRINAKYLFFTEFNLDSKIVYFLFNSIDPFVCRLISAYIFQMMETRRETSFKTKSCTRVATL